MATKKTLKQKIGGALSKVGNVIKNAVTLGATAPKTPKLPTQIPGLQTKNPNTVVINGRTVTLPAQQPNLYTPAFQTPVNATPAQLKSIAGTGTTSKKSSYTVQSPTQSVQQLSSGLGPTLAPTSAGSIQNFSSPSVGGNTYGGIGTGIGGAIADVNGVRTQNELAIQEGLQQNQTADQIALANLQKSQQQNDKFLSRFMKQEERAPSIAEQRADLNDQYNIQGKIAEIDKLTEEYNNAKLAKDAQVGQAQDKLASNNFINNQVAQIERNSAPILNRLSADINFRSGVLTQSYELINQAIDDATADKKNRWDSFRFLYDANQDSINRLDKKYTDALDRATSEAERQYKEERADKEYIRDLALQYRGAGIKITDSVDEAIAKIQRTGVTPAGGSGGSGGGRVSNRFTGTQLNTGSSRAGLPLEDFTSLPEEVQNFYVSMTAPQMKEIQSIFKDIADGKTDAQEAKNELENKALAPEVKEYLLSQIDSISPAEKEPGLFEKGWEGLKNFLGNLIPG